MERTTPEQTEPNRNNREFSYLGGAVLASGIVMLMDQILNTGWLSLLVMPGLGLVLLAIGVRLRSKRYTVPGGLLTGLGTGGYFFFAQGNLETAHRVGLLLGCFGLGWWIITLLWKLFESELVWWPIIPGGVFVSTGAAFLFGSLQWVDFVLYIGVGVGLSLLLCGILLRLFGLIIPGALLLGISPGIYAGWAEPLNGNGLTQTGIMLVWIALGWGLITVFSRTITDAFVWWPLIPGGIIAVVGWGLYIGGDPGSAFRFIGNTSSVGLMIFGIYLLLMRRSIRR